MFVALDGDVVVGHGSSFAAGHTYADVGVHVAAAYRRRGLATACAARACVAVRQAGLVPIWGTGSQNVASLRVATKLGFEEVDRLVFLVPEST